MRRTLTRDNTGLHVNLAVGYGGRYEIVDAVRKIIQKHDDRAALEELASSLTPEVIGEHLLHAAGSGIPDLAIRTSGEQRLSDFLLWQSAHSEFYFVEALGPDLREVDLPAGDPRLRDERPPLRQVNADEIGGGPSEWHPM